MIVVFPDHTHLLFYNNYLCRREYLVGCLSFFYIFKVKNIFQQIKMNDEELLQDLQKDTTQDAAIEQQEKKTISHCCWWWQQISRR